MTDPNLWITSKDRVKYFCTEAHLTRFLRVGSSRGVSYPTEKPAAQEKSKSKTKSKTKGKQTAKNESKKRPCVDYLALLDDETFTVLVGVSKERVAQFRDEYEQHLARNKIGRPHALTPLEEVLFLLLYLRHYPVDGFIGLAFLLPPGSVARVRERMLDWFHTVLKHKVAFNSLHERLQHSVSFFYNVFTWVIDGSEQGVAGCGHKAKDTLFYSAKKGKHTVNILIIIDLNGFILYISPSFPGLYADEHLVEKTQI